MGDTPLEMLELRLGRQYLFVHHGDCEHVIVFTDCWLASAIDVCHRGAYPKTTFQRKATPKMCCVCNQNNAVWACHGDKLADTSPCKLCEECHYQFHYTADGDALRTDYTIFRLFSQ